MKRHHSKLLFFFVIFFAIYSCDNISVKKTGASNHIDYYVKVVKVSDGDTFIGLTSENERIRFRMQGIDAPERKQAFSKRSTEKLSELIFEKRVGIQIHTPADRYGRPVVYVFSEDGLDIGAEMIKSGMAWHYKFYDESNLYDDLEKNARKKKMGLWKDKNPIPPWDFRKINRTKNAPTS